MMFPFGANAVMANELIVPGGSNPPFRWAIGSPFCVPQLENPGQETLNEFWGEGEEAVSV